VKDAEWWKNWYKNSFILVKEFPHSSYIKKHEQLLIDYFINSHGVWKSNQSSDTGYSIKCNHLREIDFIRDRFEEVVLDNFSGINTNYNIDCSIYIQNKENFTSVYHSHTQTSTIVATTYINVPDVGGQLEYRIKEDPCTLNLQEDMVYMFPYWLQHKPIPQHDDLWRICINLEFQCDSRVTVKDTGVRW
jgi:hypothetical protein